MFGLHMTKGMRAGNAEPSFVDGVPVCEQSVEW